jgi:hypothetical protein
MNSRWLWIFNYEPDTGLLRWRDKPSRNIFEGSYAGGKSGDGYYRVRVNNTLYYTHRIIYEIFHGRIPEGCEVDHIDGDPSNNRIQNLRLVRP